jgi:NAD(P)-dependent dehydrogenase (short-subunit alcohol dehydrogenase family)
MNPFECKVALVTGATSGIGRATAVAFARKGAKVAVAGRREDEGAKTVQMIKDAGGQGIFIRCDVKVESDVAQLIEKTMSILGRLDCAFNAAGSEHFGSVVEQPTALYDDMLTTNLRGTFLCMKYEIPQIIRAGGGAIVNASSIAGAEVGIPTNSAYAASKAGILGLTRSAALEVAANKIRVNAICGCSIDTEMGRAAWKMLGITPEQVAALNPIGRLGQPEDIAAAVLFLCSEEASYITGTALVVDGGYTCR